MIINVNAGHGRQDSRSQGASSQFIKESVEDRLVKDEVIRLLKENGATVYDTTIDFPSGNNPQKDCLNKIVALCNKHKTDLDISIHFNSGANDIKGDGKTTGTECWIYPGSKSNMYAQRIVNNIASLGFKNRGVKTSKDFAVLKTNNPCIIIECCFVDDKDDIKIYNIKSISKAIVEGVLNKSIGESQMDKHDNCILYGNEVDKTIAEVMQWEMKDCIIKNANEHIAWEGNNLYVVGGLAQSKLDSMKTGEKYTTIVGKDRWETLDKARAFVGK